MKYKLRDIYWNGGDAIFLVEFKSRYDLAMTFLRYQEYYESASSKFKGKQFTILDYMEWYAGNHEGVFSYTTDWAGFNIPDWVISDVMVRIPDRNKYDHEMHKIATYIRIKMDAHRAKYKGKVRGKFYLIGTIEGEGDVMEHEFAHGMYYLNEDYRKDMDKLVKEMPTEEREEMFRYLKNLGYAKSVWKDETQAYLSTGEFDYKITTKFVDVLDKHRPKRKIMSHPLADPDVVKQVRKVVKEISYKI